MEQEYYSNGQIGLFNPGRLSDREIESAFVARKPLFEYMLNKVLVESRGGIPQHFLILGHEGMGKSMLLNRLGVEFRKKDYRTNLLPLLLPEEQYNVDRLSKFWLNCLQALGTAMEREGNQNGLSQLETEIEQFQSKAGELEASEVLAKLQVWARQLKRRLILMVDNFNLVLDRISMKAQHQLRASLMKREAPILLASSNSMHKALRDYEAPFYDAFQTYQLKPMSFEESLRVLENLAGITGSSAASQRFGANKNRLQQLYKVVGGTPRNLTHLFPLLQNGFSPNAITDLEALLDTLSASYKTKLNQMAPQMQLILHEIAMHWEPVKLDGLRRRTFLANKQLAPQLKRLCASGLVERIKTKGSAGGSYQMADRLFNCWYLSRFGGIKQKRILKNIYT